MVTAISFDLHRSQQIVECWQLWEQESHEDLRLIFGELFLQRVNRIKDKAVFCIGVAMTSESFGHFRRLCADAVRGDQGHVGCGHISLLYVEECHLSTAQRYLETHKRDLCGMSFEVKSITLRTPDRENILISAPSRVTEVESIKTLPLAVRGSLTHVGLFLTIGCLFGRVVTLSTGAHQSIIFGEVLPEDDGSCFAALRRIYRGALGQELPTLEEFRPCLWRGHTVVYVAATRTRINRHSPAVRFTRLSPLWTAVPDTPSMSPPWGTDIAPIMRAVFKSLDDDIHIVSECIDVPRGVVQHRVMGRFGPLSYAQVLEQLHGGGGDGDVGVGDRGLGFRLRLTLTLRSMQHVGDGDEESEGVYWECVPVRGCFLHSTPFEFVTVRGGSRFPPSDPSSFQAHFDRVAEREGEGIAVFPNTGGDAVLVAPCPPRKRGAEHCGDALRGGEGGGEGGAKGGVCDGDDGVGGDQPYGHLSQFVCTAPLSVVDALWRCVGRVVAEEAARTPSHPLWVSTHGRGVPWLHVRVERAPKYYHHAAYCTEAIDR